MKHSSGTQLDQVLNRHLVNLKSHLDPKSLLKVNTHTLLPNGSSRDESLEAKWEQMQYYESHGWTSPSQGGQSGLHSLTSSVSSNSSSPSSADQQKRFRWKDVKKGSLKKLNSLTCRLGLRGQSVSEAKSPKLESAVCSAPNGDAARTLGGMLPKLRASKSMQNLEQITRDSYYSLKEKYSSRLELRQNQPAGSYAALWDEDSDGNEDLGLKQQIILQRVGLC